MILRPHEAIEAVRTLTPKATIAKTSTNRLVDNILLWNEGEGSSTRSRISIYTVMDWKAKCLSRNIFIFINAL